MTSITLSRIWSDYEPKAVCLDLFTAADDNKSHPLLFSWEKKNQWFKSDWCLPQMLLSIQKILVRPKSKGNDGSQAAEAHSRSRCWCQIQGRFFFLFQSPANTYTCFTCKGVHAILGRHDCLSLLVMHCSFKALSLPFNIQKKLQVCICLDGMQIICKCGAQSVLLC